MPNSAALKIELAKPAYNGLSDQAAADLLNTAVGTAFRSDLGIREVIGAIAPADFAAMSQLQMSKLQLVFAGGTTVDATSSNTRTIFLGIFAGMATTISNLTTLATIPGPSAAVTTFGQAVTASDVNAARK